MVIDLSGAQSFAASTVASLDAIELTYAQQGKTTRIIGLNEASTAWHGRLSGTLGAGR